MLGRVGLRARLAIALVGVAVLAVGLATLLANSGLSPRLEDAARARLHRSAVQLAQAAANTVSQRGGWTRQGTDTLEHLAMMNGLRASFHTAAGKTITLSQMGMMSGTPTPMPGNNASASVRVNGRTVGTVTVAPADGQLLTPEEQHLRHSLDRLHLVAGAISVGGALLLAFLLAAGLSRPLRRIRLAAERMEGGDLSARVEVGGDKEVRSVGHALNRLADTLEHEEELRKETVADLAHELRTPVTGLLSRIEAAQDGVLHDPAANLEAMHTETLRLTRLLDDLSKLAEAERPGLLLDMQPVDLAEVVGREVEEWQARFIDKGLRFDVELSEAWVAGDPDRLGQIAANLISNALRYTDATGRVLVQVRQEGETAVLEVRDCGIGIAADDLRRVFTRFWRGEKSRSRATGGAGIGLAIVRELALAHNGRIDVESTPGEGSRFLVLFPTLEPKAIHGHGRRAHPAARVASAGSTPR
jgi:signal transduction histidine kinase